MVYATQLMRSHLIIVPLNNVFNLRLTGYSRRDQMCRKRTINASGFNCPLNVNWKVSNSHSTYSFSDHGKLMTVITMSCIILLQNLCNRLSFSVVFCVLWTNLQFFLYCLYRFMPVWDCLLHGSYQYHQYKYYRISDNDYLYITIIINLI